MSEFQLNWKQCRILICLLVETHIQYLCTMYMPTFLHGRNAKKWTPLDCAASVGAVHCAKLLLEAHATIDPTDRTKTTPLHLAAENGHPRMLELLLARGADITMEDSQSRNPLERAILSGEK